MSSGNSIYLLNNSSFGKNNDVKFSKVTSNNGTIFSRMYTLDESKRKKIIIQGVQNGYYIGGTNGTFTNVSVNIVNNFTGDDNILHRSKIDGVSLDADISIYSRSNYTNPNNIEYSLPLEIEFHSIDIYLSITNGATAKLLFFEED